MKVLRLLDQSETRLPTDLLNQVIVRELVVSERSVTGPREGARHLRLEALAQDAKLESAGLIEVSRVKRSGNIETKMCRATAASHVPRQFLEFKSGDPRLLGAFAVFSEFQKGSRP